ncbi:protease modulator HflC [Fusibacter sp. JL298sf-3]
MNIHQGERTQERAADFEAHKRQKNAVHIKGRWFVIGAFVIIILFLLSNSFYIVREDEVAVVKQFSEIKRIVVDPDNAQSIQENVVDPKYKDVIVDTQKGLKFKVPFITSVDTYTSKLLTYISNKANINTQDKIRYDINMYAQWRITHPGIFRTSLGTITGANSKIDEVVYAVVIDRINRLNSRDFLADKEALETVLEEVKAEQNERLAAHGIALVDIDVYRTILPAGNINSTHEKMIQERNAIAQQIRSEGLEFYENTVADTDREVAEIKADAILTTETVRGEADAQALEIYGQGFSKDPDFYAFWRTLKAYENVVDEDTVIYLDKNNDFLNFFSEGR